MSRTLLAAAAGFLLGSVPFSFLLARLGGVDIRSVGSGNVGATNVTRALGWGPGAIALLLDAAKGAAAVLLARLIAPGTGSHAAVLWAGGMAIVGHNFTPFLRFRGGKGVATGLGVFAALAPGPLLLAVACFALTLAVTRMVSLGSIVACAALPCAAYLLEAPRGVVNLALLSGALVLFAHRANIARIAAGSERRLGERKPA
jgi:glycerol-3-phosphate acyltransferase PlsY